MSTLPSTLGGQRLIEMTIQAKQQIKKPTKMVLAKGEKVLDKVIRENQAWLKEMADK